MAGLVAIQQGHPLVGQQGAAVGAQIGQGQATVPLDPVHLVSAGPNLAAARIEVVDIDFICVVVLGDQAHRIGLDAQVGVLGDQDHRRLAANHLMQTLFKGNSQDVVVTAAALQLRGQLAEGFTAAEHHL